MTPRQVIIITLAWIRHKKRQKYLNSASSLKAIERNASNALSPARISDDKFAFLQRTLFAWLCTVVLLMTAMVTRFCWWMKMGKKPVFIKSVFSLHLFFAQNNHRCAQDRYILKNLDYLGDLMAGQESHVFKYADKTNLFFQCQVRIAVKEPKAQCKVNFILEAKSSKFNDNHCRDLHVPLLREGEDQLSKNKRKTNGKETPPLFIWMSAVQIWLS